MMIYKLIMFAFVNTSGAQRLPQSLQDQCWGFPGQMKPELELRSGFLASVFTVGEFRDALMAESVRF